MKCNRVVILLLVTLILMIFVGCQPQKQTEFTVQPTQTLTTETVIPTQIAAIETMQAIIEETTTPVTDTLITEAAEQEQPEMQEKSLHMSIDGRQVEVAWEDNDSVAALRELCADSILTIPMSMYGGFEQVGSLGTTLPSNDVDTTTASGDIVLYSSNSLVVFYGSNTWAYTRLGHIINLKNAELADWLSNGDVTIALYIE